MGTISKITGIAIASVSKLGGIAAASIAQMVGQIKAAAGPIGTFPYTQAMANDGVNDFMQGSTTLGQPLGDWEEFDIVEDADAAWSMELDIMLLWNANGYEIPMYYQSGGNIIQLQIYPSGTTNLVVRCLTMRTYAGSTIQRRINYTFNVTAADHFSVNTNKSTWHRVTLVKSTSTDYRDMRLYLNGTVMSSVGTYTHPGDADENFTDTMISASNFRNIYLPLYNDKINVGMFAFYDKALNNTEINEHYDGGARLGGSADEDEIMVQDLREASTADNLKYYTFYDAEVDDAPGDVDAKMLAKVGDVDFYFKNGMQVSQAVPHIPVLNASAPPAANYAGESATFTQASSSIGTTMKWYSDPGYTLSFDGTDDYVNLDSAASTVSGASGSFSIWVKFDDTATGTSTKYALDITADSENYIRMFLRQTQDYAGVWHEAGDTFKESRFASGEDWDGDPLAWHHVVATWSDATGDDELIVYVDGSQDLVSVNTVTGLGTFSGTPVNLRLGHGMAHGTGNLLMEGNINDVAIWSSVLTAAEVAAIYNSGVPTELTTDSGDYASSDDLVGYWKFDSGSGTTIVDSSTNSNTGSLINGTSFEADTSYSASNSTQLLLTSSINYTFTVPSSGSHNLYVQETKTWDSPYGEVSQDVDFSYNSYNAGHATHAYWANGYPGESNMALVSPGFSAISSSGANSGSFSFTGWFSCDNTYSWRPIMYAPVPGTSVQFSILGAFTSYPQFYLQSPAGAVYAYFSSAGNVFTGLNNKDWVHITFSWDVTTGIAYCFANGQNCGTVTNAYLETAFGDGGSPYINIMNNWTDLKIANFAVYDNALSVVEMAAINTSGQPGSSLDLSALSGSSDHILEYWKINGDSYTDSAGDVIEGENGVDIPVANSVAGRKTTDRP